MRKGIALVLLGTCNISSFSILYFLLTGKSTLKWIWILSSTSTGYCVPELEITATN